MMEQLEKLNAKQDFEDFLALLAKDFQKNNSNWENVSLESYLNSLHSFSKDVEGYYQNNSMKMNVNNPSWRLFADILLGARIYE